MARNRCAWIDQLGNETFGICRGLKQTIARN
jgi:hypothetical protein